MVTWLASFWVFLNGGHFAAKPKFMAIGFPWISLDSLVRIKTYQWVTREKRSEDFSRRFCHSVRSPHDVRLRSRHSEGRIAHEESLAGFRLFCNQLSPEPLLGPMCEWGLSRFPPHSSSMYFVSLTRSPFFDYRPVNHTGFPRRRMEPLSVIWVAADFPVEKRIAEPRFASPHPRFHEWTPKDRQPLTLLRRLMIEIERLDSPVTGRDTLDAGCDRASRAVGRPTILELKPSTASPAPRAESPTQATHPRRRPAHRAIPRKLLSRP